MTFSTSPTKNVEALVGIPPAFVPTPIIDEQITPIYYINIKRSLKDGENGVKVIPFIKIEKDKLIDLAGYASLESHRNSLLVTSYYEYANRYKEPGATNQPSAIPLFSTEGYISAPEVPDNIQEIANSIQGDSTGVSSLTEIKWRIPNEIYDPVTGSRRPVGKVLSNGQIHIIPQSRLAPSAMPAFELTPKLYSLVGKQGAFVLTLNIEPGCEGNLFKDLPWKVLVKFGEYQIEIREGDTGLWISREGDKEGATVSLSEEMLSRTVTNAGRDPLIISVIPVWNGIVVGTGIPNEGSSPKSFVFYRKNKDTCVAEEVHRKLFPENKARKIPSKIPKELSSDGQYHSAILLPNKPEVIPDFGRDLKVTMHRCGGILHYQPLKFTETTSFHLLTDLGAATPLTNAVADFSGDNPPELPEVTFADNFLNEDSPVTVSPRTKDHIVVPIFFYNEMEELEFNAGNFRLPRMFGPGQQQINQNQRRPTQDSHATFTRKDSRTSNYPLQIFGYVLYRRSYSSSLRPKVQEGFVTQDDVPKERIREISVSRSLSGSSGSISWDAFDVITGITGRPPQRVGAIQIAVDGGADTVPGIIFTGLAMGNAAQDVESQNEVSIPLVGKETRLSSEGGLVAINFPYFDGVDHVDVMKILSDYSGITLRNLAGPYLLPSTQSLQAPMIDFVTGTPILDCIDQVCKYASCLRFFDRLGNLVYIDVRNTSGKNWDYPEHEIITLNDEPDLSNIRNDIVVSGLVGSYGEEILESGNQKARIDKTQAKMVRVSLDTNPHFDWSRMAHMPLRGILKTEGEFIKAVIQVAKGISRPRASGSTSIPGNAEIDLLDTFNKDWVVTQITHSVSTQSKRWTTSLGLEYYTDFEPSGTITSNPLPNL